MSNNHGRQAQGNTSRKMISGSSMYVHNLAGHVDIRAGSPPKSAGQHGGGSSLRSAVAWHLVAQQMPQMWAVACGEDAAACQWHDARGQLLPRECRRLAALQVPAAHRVPPAPQPPAGATGGSSRTASPVWRCRPRLPQSCVAPARPLALAQGRWQGATVADGAPD